MKAIAVAAILLLAHAVVAMDYHGHSWQQKSADEKYSTLNKGVAETPKTPGYPSQFEQAALFIEGMDLSFNTVGDDMPKEGPFGLITRRKLLHAVGLMASATWTVVPNSLGYTGIFNSGSTDLMVRFSSGNEPQTAGNSSGMIAAVAFKFLRNGVSSANIHTLGNVGPQDSFNFFAHDFSNHQPDFPFTAPPASLVIRSLFTTASSYPTYLGLSKVADADADGNKVAQPKYPWRLIFHPTTALHNAFPAGNPGQLWYKQLANSVKPGQAFGVFAIDQPMNDNVVSGAKMIAVVTLTSGLTESYFGDRTLFYQHTSMEDDFKYMSSWKAAADKVQFWQRNQTTQFTYSDLPWN